MKPLLFEVFGIPVASWYLFFALAGIACFYFSRWILIVTQASQASQSSQESVARHSAVFSWGYVAGWFGARGLSILREDLSSQGFWKSLPALLELGSMTFYGGALFATLVGLLLCRVWKLSVVHQSAAFVPAGVLALGIGRIGCFLNGDDFGKPLVEQANPPWWAHVNPVLGDGLFRYPAQLQEAVFSIVLAGVVFFVFKARSEVPMDMAEIENIGMPDLQAEVSSSSASPDRILRIGMSSSFLRRTTWTVVLLSASNRFLNEFLRGDPRGQFWGTSLSTSQGIAVLLVCLSAAFLLQELRNGKEFFS